MCSNILLDAYDNEMFCIWTEFFFFYISEWKKIDVFLIFASYTNIFCSKQPYDEF